VFSLAEDRNHDILVGTFGGGVFRFRDGHFIVVSAPDRLTNRVVTAIVPAKNGALWIAYSDGLERVADGRDRRFTTADGLSSNDLLSANEDRRGVLWVETTRGIDRLKEDHFITVLTADSVSTGEGRFGFGEDRFGELFAFGPATATFHIQEDRVDRLNGAPWITGMIRSPENLWFCGDGIYRAAPDSLQKWEHERDTPPGYTRFNRTDGMNTTRCSDGFRNMAVTHDGRLWVATEQGIAMLEFSRLRHTDRKPAIFIEKVVIGKTVRPPGRELVLPAGTQHVELHFDTIELASPEATRMQYRLDDVDREWLDADSSVTAVYSGIPVGTHEFHVRACNSDGAWEQIEIVYNVTQKPYFYETNLFHRAGIAMFASLALMLFWALYRFRLGQVTREFDVRLEERLEERTRIARELHDTLLQSLHGLMFEFQAARNMFQKRPEEALHALDGAIMGTEQAITESQDAIEHLRCAATAEEDLAQLIKVTGEDLAASRSGDHDCPTFGLTVEGQQRALAPVIRDEIYRIAREVLRNAFRHAQARRIEAEILYDEDQFRLRVRDDGKGMDLHVLEEGRRAGHWGLPGVRERAQQIGAKLDVWSETGAGTEVQLAVAASVAYRKRLACSRFRLFQRTGNHERQP
jgi:signal transduction histidine kinase